LNLVRQRPFGAIGVVPHQPLIPRIFGRPKIIGVCLPHPLNQGNKTKKIQERLPSVSRFW
jgi:hypothetical protein